MFIGKTTNYVIKNFHYHRNEISVILIKIHEAFGATTNYYRPFSARSSPMSN